MKIHSLLILILLATPALAAQDVIIYADDEYAPYSYRDGKEGAGIYAEIITRATNRMVDYNVTIMPLPWKRGLAQLETGKGFAIFPPYKLPKLRPYMDYSAPILEETVVVFMRDEILIKKERQEWPDDFLGLRVGQNLGFRLGGEKFWQAVENGEIFLEEARSTQVNLLKLGLGRIDCYINDRTAILMELNRLKKRGDYDEGGTHAKLVEGPVVNSEWGHLGITNRGNFPYKNDFIERFNAEIKKMQDSGEIQKIINSYIGQ